MHVNQPPPPPRHRESAKHRGASPPNNETSLDRYDTTKPSRHKTIAYNAQSALTRSRSKPQKVNNVVFVRLEILILTSMSLSPRGAQLFLDPVSTGAEDRWAGGDVEIPWGGKNSPLDKTPEFEIYVLIHIIFEEICTTRGMRNGQS